MLIKISFFFPSAQLDCVTALQIQTNFLRKLENFCKGVHYINPLFSETKTLGILPSSNTRDSGFFIFLCMGNVGHTWEYVLVLQRPRRISLTLRLSCLGLQPQCKVLSFLLATDVLPWVFPSWWWWCVLVAISAVWISLSKWPWNAFNIGTKPIETCRLSNRGCSQFLWPETTILT